MPAVLTESESCLLGMEGKAAAARGQHTGRTGLGLSHHGQEGGSKGTGAEEKQMHQKFRELSPMARSG